MATFELNNSGDFNTGRTAERFARRPDNPHANTEKTDESQINRPPLRPEGAWPLPPIKQESIIALKIYDSCRQQDCLEDDDLGPARSACDQFLHELEGTHGRPAGERSPALAEQARGEGEHGKKHFKEGEIIIAPDNAASVSIEDLRIKRIIIVNKKQNPFRRGFWDVDLKYIFEYCIVFLDARGCEIGSLKALSTFNMSVTLFGSIGSDIVMATDMFVEGSAAMSLDPFVLAEAKALALAAKLKPRQHRGGRDSCNEIFVTIGLFTIVKLYRLVTLIVESRGFDVPRKCTELSPINVCDFFDDLPFPMDVFAPPQKREFESGQTLEIYEDNAAAEALNEEPE